MTETTDARTEDLTTEMKNLDEISGFRAARVSARFAGVTCGSERVARDVEGRSTLLHKFEIELLCSWRQYR